MDAHATERLKKLLGMLGSEFPGERANAAAMADSLARKLGLTWHEIIISSSSTTSPSYRFGRDDFLSVEELFHFALLAEEEDLLNPWERGFLINVYDRQAAHR